MSENTEKFGERLRQLRQHNGMTQQEMARYLQVHRTTYTKYETQGVVPDLDALLRIASLFGVSVDYLLGKQQPDAPPQPMVRDGVMPIRLNEQEMLLLLTFRRLNGEKRDEVLHLAEDLVYDEQEN